MAQRIQLSRRKGWRLHEVSTNPNGVVIVDRRSKWGNPFHVGVDGNVEQCVELYRRWLNGEISEADTNWRYALKATGIDGRTIWLGKHLIWAGALEELRGKDLACWCATDVCHASVLLELVRELE